MNTTFSKTLLFAFSTVFWLAVPRIVADDARFFRVVGPTPATITSVTSDGYIIWTNAQIGTNYTVQVARSLGDPTNWADYVQVPVSNNVIIHRLFDPNPPPGMVLIPAGSFTMGNCMDPSEGDSDEFPLHTVYVSAFYMDRYEVTKVLWDDVYNWAVAHGYSFRYRARGKANNHPAQNMMWYDAAMWCNARSEKENKTPAYYTDPELQVLYRNFRSTFFVNWNSGYRLPTEAEWEKAARGGASGHRFSWPNVDTITHSQANYISSSSYTYDISPTRDYPPAFNDGVFPYTSPVGYFAANGFGLYDMVGNVNEWCWDWYGSYSSGSQSDPRGPASGSIRVIRGGGWHTYAVGSRTAAHYGCDPSSYETSIGFRSVLPTGQP